MFLDVTAQRLQIGIGAIQSMAGHHIKNNFATGFHENLLLLGIGKISNISGRKVTKNIVKCATRHKRAKGSFLSNCSHEYQNVNCY